MSDPHLPRVHRIVDKLGEVRRRGLSTFGSEDHEFRLNPPIAEPELETFEQSHGIRLPDEYRCFLLHAGNGGAGPYYGIYPLAKSDYHVSFNLKRHPDFLTRPCQLQPGRNQYKDWSRRTEDASPYQGTLPLGTQGCSYEMRLMVSGEFRGRVVYLAAEQGSAYVIREPDFLAWYERWLDELLWGYKNSWFGYGPGGDEEEFFRILNDLHSDIDLRHEALGAFCGLPQLSEAAGYKIKDYCRHSSADMRSTACCVLRTFKIHHADDEVNQLLDDPAPPVRRQAVYAAMAINPSRWIDDIRRMVHDDPDCDVAISAYFQLKGSAALTKPELLRIIKHSPCGGLRSCAAHAMEWDAGDHSVLTTLLFDPNTLVRFYATLGLRRIKTRDSLPHVVGLLERETDPLVVGSILRMLGEMGDSSSVPCLLKFASCQDDFHRLEAIESLAKIGDERAVSIAAAMLREHRCPVGKNAEGRVSDVQTISNLTRSFLKASPSRALRDIAEEQQ